ncbi:DMT family transporter [Salipaludibacillus daqingensis]|uniref:DMT family transporter n=1 Tax=Salipaludibacillus daqingensis TaxID=3041001 RepID=UPI002475E5C0|nr:DMT family transporter [Salipaludibacillus daqingensis]
MSRFVTYILLVMVMVIWGLNVVAVKYLVEHFPPVMMQGLRIGTASLFAILILYFLKDLRKLSKKEWGLTILAALFGQIGHHSLLAIGLLNTTASNASLILGLIPLTTAIFAMIFLGDRLTKIRFIGIIFGFSGVAFVVLNPEQAVSGISSGDLLVFTSMVSQAFSFILIKKITSTLSSRQLTGMLLMIGSISLITISFFFEPGSNEAFSVTGDLIWIVFFSSAIIATGLGHFLFNAAIQKIGAGQTAIFNNFVPFFALLGSFFLLNEALYLSQLIGFAFIVIGVLLGTGYVEQQWLRRRQKQPLRKTS